MRRREHERIVREKDKRIEALERQVENLIDRLMYASGKPWTPAPVEVPVWQVPDDDLQLVPDIDQEPL